MTPSPESGRRILVVDDGIGAAKMLQLLLSKLGPHEIEIAYDGVAALEAARRFAPDLVLLDIGLPRMDGYEVARQLRASADFQTTTLVAITGYGDAEDRERSAAAGFNEHIVKPVDLETLKRLLTYPKRGAIT
jgi:two-component system CheB/CheR fusion protein